MFESLCILIILPSLARLVFSDFDEHPTGSFFNVLAGHPDFKFTAQRVRCDTKPTAGICDVQALGNFFPLVNRDADIALVVVAVERLWRRMIVPSSKEDNTLYPIISFIGGSGIGK